MKKLIFIFVLTAAPLSAGMTDIDTEIGNLTVANGFIQDNVVALIKQIGVERDTAEKVAVGYKNQKSFDIDFDAALNQKKQQDDAATQAVVDAQQFKVYQTLKVKFGP